MRSKVSRLAAALLAWAVVVNCGGGGTGGSDGAAGGAGGSTGGGTEISSCTLSDGSLCTQLVIPSTSSARSAEQSTCTTKENGTSGMGCAATGIVGCCLPKAGDPSKEEQCVYTANEAAVVMGLCTSKGQTWSTTM
jgi:hypothetical protein